MRYHIGVLLPIFGALTSSPCFGQDRDALDVLLSPDRQAELGLNKLTSEERAALLDALAQIYEAGVVAGGKTSSAPSSSAPRQTTSAVIESKVDGAFEGWDGETIVKLINGQIWKQTEYHYHYHYAYMPDVLIYNSGGGYKMQVEGVNRPVGVERLR
jgi:hypothetical protein